jgi:hypothetical protein
MRHISRRPTDEEPNPLVTVDRLREPHVYTTPSPHFAAEHADDTHEEKQVPKTVRERWARIWPSLLAVVTLSAVGGPAAVASYRHARDVITEHGDPVMAPRDLHGREITPARRYTRRQLFTDVPHACSPGGAARTPAVHDPEHAGQCRFSAVGHVHDLLTASTRRRLDRRPSPRREGEGPG